MELLNELVTLIEEAKKLYYQDGRSFLTDAEYDDLVERAKKLGYIETVGAAPVDKINKITHEHPMLSLDKCHSFDDVKKFSARRPVVIMHKADGLTCSATYIDGILTRLETRGDGNIGNDIMFHARSFENLPITINKSGKYVIDGECVILKNDFEKINNKLIESERYSRPRNLAAGSLNQLDASVSAKRHLRFYAWDVIEGGKSENSLYQNLLEASSLGFDVVGHIKLYDDWAAEDYINQLKFEADSVGFPIDGIVIKYDDIKYGATLGRTVHHPKNAISFKFRDDLYETKLIDINWQVGKSGQITPVAIFQPVNISGVIIEKASLHNISIIKQLGLTNGCTCYVSRKNDVIPQIIKADDDGNGEIYIPETCPVCGGVASVIKENKSEVLYCTNDDCPGKLLGKYVTFVSKAGMDIDGLSEETLRKFLRLGYLTNMFHSIYDLGGYKKELYKLDGFGKKSIDNLLSAIEKSKDIELDHFIVAFSIPGIGSGQAKLLANTFKTFSDFMKACDDLYDFTKIPGIGSVLNANLHKWWINNHMQMIDVAQEMRFKNDDKGRNNSAALAGKTFVITGAVYHFINRDELKECIEANGGKVTGSVSKNTDYLINNDVNSTTGKNLKALQLGVKIISEDEFLAMIK